MIARRAPSLIEDRMSTDRTSQALTGKRHLDLWKDLTAAWHRVTGGLAGATRSAGTWIGQRPETHSEILRRYRPRLEINPFEPRSAPSESLGSFGLPVFLSGLALIGFDGLGEARAEDFHGLSEDGNSVPGGDRPAVEPVAVPTSATEPARPWRAAEARTSTRGAGPSRRCRTWAGFWTRMRSRSTRLRSNCPHSRRLPGRRAGAEGPGLGGRRPRRSRPPRARPGCRARLRSGRPGLASLRPPQTPRPPRALPPRAANRRPCRL